MPTITGHHHISMITKHAKENKFFYSDLLGLRLVKKTVNQDSPDMYHLFYGDEVGSPGTELTFFEMPRAGHTRKGTNAISSIGLLVPNDSSLDYWSKRLSQHGIEHSGIISYGPYSGIQFDDPDQLTLILLSNEGREAPKHIKPWAESPVPQKHAIMSMGAVGIKVREMAKSVALLTELFGYTIVHQTPQETTLQAVAGEQWGEIIITEQAGERTRAGRGSVHHLALSVPNHDELQQWNDSLLELGYKTTGVIDRYYFASLYFRDPNGIMYELATEGPGFTIDSDASELGKNLDLPPFLELKRAEIEASLESID